ncbi:MAG: patatin-like phospholipase family protein [Nocardiopsaceae bacterium]|nr:patatin-like phospholipase family protein [Nocardiopsaceae bacterium]
MHEVLKVLGERAKSRSAPGRRDDGLRIALGIEGGGMRGTVTAGMAYALHELGMTRAFDAVYGASAGAINGAWLVSSRPEGLRGWTDPSFARALIRWRALLRGRPVVDVRTLIEEVYVNTFPMDFASVIASPVEYHPLATDAATGKAEDLRPLVSDVPEMRLALRASAALPFLAGPPVTLRGRRFYDAGVAESIPFRTPLAHGATHVLVLRSKLPMGPVHDGTLVGFAGLDASRLPPPPRSARVLTRTTLRGESRELRSALLSRTIRTLQDVSRIAELEAAGRAFAVYGSPAIMPPVSRMTTDGGMLAAAFEAGRSALHHAFTPSAEPG